MTPTTRVPLKSLVNRIAYLRPLVVAGTLAATAALTVAQAPHANAQEAHAARAQAVGGLEQALREISSLDTSDMSPAEATSAMGAIARVAIAANPAGPGVGMVALKAPATDGVFRQALASVVEPGSRGPESRRGIAQGALDKLGLDIPDRHGPSDVVDALERRADAYAAALKDISGRIGEGGRVADRDATTLYVAKVATDATKETASTVALDAEAKAEVRSGSATGERLQRIVVANARSDSYRAALEDVVAFTSGAHQLHGAKQAADSGLANGNAAVVVVEEALSSAPEMTTAYR